ncbi:uncharacterized protein FA14DRAFT_70623 [Meira miltonrushii]|uniref:SAP domain-containing protein n=1 Tax=Meira miltonrushii TaxID=1280837 RepID=A0A316V9S8_9BASI|nr:uncharacterized protein FA14DRAFT_70623 [Meira miltonrushii]PWN34256.1 hypothetical protein FA14DRAFT_70623 [Meira miltonrushii]
MPSSSSSSSSLNTMQEDGQPLVIHAEGLPCLKRQQLENLCIRLGVKSTGKKSELIARLEGFAMGKSASVMSNLNAQAEVPEEVVETEQAPEMNTASQESPDEQKEEDEEGADDGDISMLPNTASIRVISKPRESHFVSAMPDPFEMEIGVVLPRSDSSNGSLSSLSKRSVSGTTLKELDMQKPNLPSTQQNHMAEEKSTKRTVSGSSLYPWKKLMGSHKASSESLSKKDESSEANNAQQTAAGPSTAEMGLGLTASDSQASISSAFRKWLKGEGTSSITPSFPSTRRVTRSASAASSVLNASKAEEEKGPLQQEVEQPQAISEAPISKRKRSIGEGDTSHDDCGVPTSPEVPQRRIKPRPSRAKRSNVTPSMESATSPSAQEKVWAEMQARMAAKAKESSEGESRKVSGASSIGSGAQTPNLPPSPLKSVNSRTKGRFSSQHDKQFGRMDSIASHYSARRDVSSGTGRARKVSEAIEDEKDAEKQVAPVKKARLDAPAEDKEVAPAANKAITIAPADPALPQRTDEERAAIKRKLELARHRRRSSTAAARASASSATARRAAAAHAGPSSKLSSAIKSGGFASKISFAVRGFMGAAARGLTSNSTVVPPAVEKVKEQEVERSTSTSMAPPATPSIGQKSLEKKPSVQTLTATSPSKSSSALAKKRSTFDLQASLARKPTGYTPYSAKETIGMLNSSPMKPSTFNADSSSVSRSSSINFPSTSPVKKTVVKEEMEEDTENQEPSSMSPTPSTPVSPRVGMVKKTRSSASHSARSSIKAGRKSNINNASRASAARSSGVNGTPNSRKRPPSLQSVNQTMAKDIVSARRSRTNAMHTSGIPQRQFRQSASHGNRRSSAAINATATLRNSTSSTINAPPPLPAPPAAGHGSPRKGNSSAFVEGKGRGKSGFLESDHDSIPRASSQPQRKRSTQALTMQS